MLAFSRCKAAQRAIAVRPTGCLAPRARTIANNQKQPALSMSKRQLVGLVAGGLAWAASPLSRGVAMAANASNTSSEMEQVGATAVCMCRVHVGGWRACTAHRGVDGLGDELPDDTGRPAVRGQ